MVNISVIKIVRKIVFSGIFPVLVIPAFLMSCDDDYIRGNGQQVLEHRDVNYFTRLNITGSYNISYSKSDSCSCDIFAESNILPYIKTTVNNQILNVDTESHRYSIVLPKEITLTSPVLEEISTSGAIKFDANFDTLDELHIITVGLMEMNGVINANRLYIDVSGTGMFNLEGSAVYTEIDFSGTGNIHTENMEQDSCKIDVSGSALIYVKVNKYLKVKITGAGEVYYYGNPDEVISNISGAGKLIKMDGK